MAANQVDFKILPSDQFSVYSPATRSDKVITYFTLLSKLRGDILSVGQDDDPNNIVSAFYSSVGGTQTLHLVKADGSEITASQPEQIISGTVNFVSKFTTANDIGDSQIFDNGTNVGIGTTSMTHKLQLATGGVFADYYQLDTTYTNGFVVGAISWDIDNGTADIGLSSTLKLKIGQDDTWYVKNQSGSTITKGTVVYASGTLGASGRITIAPMIANGTIPSRFLLGIVAENILNGADGYVIAKGKIRQINTNAFNDGDVLWVSPTVAGALTVTEPTAPNLKLAVAFVVHKATNGILAVRTTTGVRIADASDVEYAGAADNSFLIYNSATGVWEDEAVGIFKNIAVTGQSSVVADTYDDTLTLVAGTNITITTDATTDSITINSTDQFVGTVTSVNMSVPTGFAISGNPITTSGTLAVAFDTGYSLPTNASQATWNTAYNDSITAFAYNTSTAVLTLTQQDAGTLTATVTLQPFSTSNLAEGTNLYYTDTRARLALSAGTGISYSTTTGVITNSAPDLTVVLTASTGISVTGTYPSFTIANTAPDQTVVLTGGTGITTSGTYPSFTVTNSDRGSSQNIFKNIAVAGQSTIVADVNDDTLTVVAGSGVTITTNDTTDTITISATGSGGSVTSVATTAPITGGTITTTGTIGITQSGAAADGYLSSTDWNTFNNKQNALTNPVTGTGTTNYVPKWTTASAIGDSLIYDSGTKVGISTTGPTAKLEILNSPSFLPTLGTASGNLALTDNGLWGMYFGLEGSSGKGWIQQMRNDSITSYPLLIQPVGGNVGIGTTAPGQKLQVDGSLLVNTGTSATAFRDIMMGGIGGWSSGESHGIDTVYNTAASPTTFSRIESHFDGTNGKMRFRNLFNASAPRTDILMTIQGNGNVGIGTDDPGAKLDVRGQTYINNGTSNALFIDTTVADANTRDAIYLFEDDGQASGRQAISWWNGNQSYYKARLWTEVGGSFAATTFGIDVADNSRTVATRLVINNGNVGIGNTAPSQILHVTGNIRVTGAYYDSANAAGTSGQILSSTGTGTSWIAAPSGGGISGSGTTNYVPKWTSGSAIGDSAIYDNAGNVGIGNTAPNQKLELSVGSAVTGGLRINYSAAATSEGMDITYLNSGNTTTSFDSRYNSDSAVMQFRMKTAATAVNAMTILGSGNIGINTTAPVMKLHVSDVGANIISGNAISTSTMKGVMIQNTNNGDESIGMWFNTGGNHWSGITGQRTAAATNWATDLRFFTHEAALVDLTYARERMRIDGEGNVGIGTTGPGYKLDVRGAFGTSPGIYISGTTYGMLGVNKEINNASSGVQYYNVGSQKWFTGIYENTDDFGFYSVGTAGFPMVIKYSTGNVGIGTTNPTAKLYIEGGSANWNETTPGLSVGTIHLDPGVTTDNFGNAITFGASDASSGTDAQAGIYVRSDGAYGTKMYFATTDAYVTGSQTRMYISEGGNVGIGTTSPSYKLDVTGDARINTGALGVNIAPSATDGRIDASNDIVAFSSSDLRLKENIKPIENALEKVKSLTGVEFDWKPELKHAHGYEGHDTGVIAQEVQEVMPTAIRTNDTGYLAVRYEKLIGLLIEANKELAARVEELESKLK